MEQNRDNEVIVCAAVRDPKTMIVYPSVRHGDEIFWIIMDDKNPSNTDADCSHFTQGFLTNKQRFVNRSEAWEIAEREGQIRFELPCDDKRQLYSENLY